MVQAATRQNIHGAALVLFGALIPVGEGAAFAALGLAAVAIALRHREADFGVLLRGTARSVHIGLAIWLGAGLLALFLSSQGWHKPSELGLWSPFLAIPVLIASAPMLDEKWFHRAAIAFVVMLGVASLYGIIQFALDARPGEDLFRYTKTRTGQIAIPGGRGGTIAGGFFFHRLKMAHVLLPGIGILVVRQLFATPKLGRRFAEAALLALTGATLILTFTRGAVIALVVALAACLPFTSRRIRWASIVAVALATSAALSVPRVRERVVSIASSEAMQVRGFIWARGATIVADHPFGTGLGNYPHTVTQYYNLSDPHFDVLTYPHNVVLAALAETGPVGMLGYFWVWAAVLAACAGILWRRRDTTTRVVIAATGLFGVIALWAVGLTHDVLFHKPVSLAFAGLIGWVVAMLDRKSDPA